MAVTLSPASGRGNSLSRPEQAWECPCHGSRFAPDGQVLQGPAVRPLEPRDI